jgi:hypothetical protein
MDLADYVDDTATLFGIAENAAHGAILRCGGDAHIYIDGLSEWDDSEQYAAFEVTGTSSRKAVTPICGRGRVLSCTVSAGAT